MANRESFSVAMCTYNGEKYLPEQLASIATQSRQPDELVVCDDASTDRTLEILENFRGQVRFPVRIFVNEVNLGSTKNFEKAIRLCAGKNIALADQDDVWFEGKLERLGQVLEASSLIGAVFSDALVVDSTLRPLGYRLWESRWFGSRDQKRLHEGQGFEVLLSRNVVTGATLAFRSALRKSVLPIPPCWVHDGWIALIVSAHSDIVAVTEPLIYYRQHEQQQVGARRIGIGAKISLVLEASRRGSAMGHDHRPTAQQYTEIGKHFRSTRIGEDAIDALRMNRLEEKIRHLTIRETLPTGLFRRSAVILPELAQGRYHSYSAGWESAIWDLLRRR
jgi:glycosyltransferase involved in cell wall biosynthesis